MENIETSQQGNKRSRGKNNSATSRRVWQMREEDALMTAMMELKGPKWRNENGFKPGFYAQLEMKLKVQFPGTDLCANPHIESKVKLWKRHYYAVLGMLQTSGFGWNDTDKTIDVESDQVWANYVKKDITVKTWRNKPFPYYDNWCVFFGKDRATGDLAEGPEEAQNAMNHEEMQSNDNSFHMPSPTDFSDNIPTPMQTGSSSGRKRSRSRNDGVSTGLASLAEQFGNFCDKSDGSLNAIAQRIGYEQDLSEARRQVYDKLAELPLDTTSRLKAGSMICNEASKVDYFFSIPTAEERVEYVYLLLSRVIE